MQESYFFWVQIPAVYFGRIKLMAFCPLFSDEESSYQGISKRARMVLALNSGDFSGKRQINGNGGALLTFFLRKWHDLSAVLFDYGIGK